MPPLAMRPTIAVVGGGIVGLAVAHKLTQSERYSRITLVEKESEVGRHQSTHNSGVLHAGLYYTPGSLKARFAVAGLRQMVAFCRDHGIAHEQCGKLVVATNAIECGRLRALLARGTSNGLTGLRWLDGVELREIEPHAVGLAAVHVPEEGIVDYGAVCTTIRQLLEDSGADVALGKAVETIDWDGQRWIIGAGERTIRADYIVACAGLQADRVARMAGEQPESQIVPFRGEYYKLRGEREYLVRNLIYPVPDPDFPFLGVHFTRMIHGGIEAGPNAVLALAREGYRKRDLNLRDCVEALRFPGLARFIRRNPRIVGFELLRSYSRTLFVRSLRRLVPEIRGSDIVAGGAGVRAQAMRRSGELVQDFDFIVRQKAVHVLSAPSPGATASFAIADEIVSRLAKL